MSYGYYLILTSTSGSHIEMVNQSDAPLLTAGMRVTLKQPKPIWLNTLGRCGREVLL